MFWKHRSLFRVQALAPGGLPLVLQISVSMFPSQKGFPRLSPENRPAPAPYALSQHPTSFSSYRSPWSIWYVLLSGPPPPSTWRCTRCRGKGENNPRLPPWSLYKIVTGKRDIPNELNDTRGRQWIISSRVKSYGTLALKLGCILESSGGFKNTDGWIPPPQTDVMSPG